MDMKKISCAVLIAAAASMSAVMAAGPEAHAPAPGAAHAHAPAPGPAHASGSTVALPVVGSMIGASLLSFLAFYLQ